MSAVFVDSVAKDVELSGFERAFLAAAGVRSYETLYNMLLSFPALAELGINMPRLSAIALRANPRMAAQMGREHESGPNAPAAIGALAPLGVSHPVGARVPMPPINGSFGAVGPNSGLGPLVTGAAGGSLMGIATSPIDLRLPGWVVKDQGDRGTCVAFAAASCCEYAENSVQGSGVRLSEQFLYWATKTHPSDPNPGQDGTWLSVAGAALQQSGICEASLWPYSGIFDAANIPHHNPPNSPSQTANQNALTRRGAGTHALGPKGGGAVRVWRTLAVAKAPVAISLPVFTYPGGPYNNWNTPLGTLHGEVLDPLPGSIAIGGHAVCVTGWIPDASEACGGFFVIRNSWNTSWGTGLPIAGYGGPEPGYGQVSASYVNNYLWETFHL